jgi:6-phosphogluconolactonase (cycloisomerase 2 family)
MTLAKAHIGHDNTPTAWHNGSHTACRDPPRETGLTQRRSQMTRPVPIAARLTLIAAACGALAGCGSDTPTTIPPVVTYTIGGSVSGLVGTGLVLQDNGGANLPVTANGTFTFGTAVATAGAYAVTVLTQPTGQTCTVTVGSGTVGTANVTNVVVTCVTPTFTISATVSGLTGTGLVLQDNGASNLTVTANGTATFATALNTGATYAVTVLTQPTGQTCTVGAGTGTVAAANVTSVTVTCVATTFTISATVSGLTGTGLVLQDNGAANLAVSANGTATFTTGLATGATYAVTVLTQPTAQACLVANGSGTVATANVTGITVTCSSLSAEFLYGANSNDGINAYSINTSTGVPTAIAGSPFATQVAGSTSLGWLTADPVANVLFFSLVRQSTASSTSIQAWSANTTTGALTTVPGAPFAANSPIGPMSLTPNGSFAYTANFIYQVGTTVFPFSITGYSIDANGALTGIASNPFPVDSVGPAPSAVVVTPDGKFIYSANTGTSAGGPGNITGYSLNSATGALTALPSSPFASNDSITIVFTQLSISPNGKFLFMSGGNGIAVYTIGSSGALTAVAGSPFASAAFASGMSIDPSGRFLYVGNSTSNGQGTGAISGYTINSSTGALTPITGSPFNVGTFALSVVVDISGQFLYSGNIGTTANSQSSSIGAFTINQTTGALTAISGSPFFGATGSQTGGSVYLAIMK